MNQWLLRMSIMELFLLIRLRFPYICSNLVYANNKCCFDLKTNRNK